MKTFIRIISPITLAVVVALDCAVGLLGYYCVKRIIEEQSFITISFVVIEVVAIVIALLTTKESLSNGVIIDDKKIEFTGLDENNIFEYENIEKIETSKDTSASLTKNFVDRYSKVVIRLKDESIVTIDLGLTTKGTLKKIEQELNSKIK